MKVHEELGLEPSLRRSRHTRLPSIAHRRHHAGQIERDPDASDALAGRSIAEGIAPLRDVAMDEEERGIVEELAAVVEEQVEEGAAIGSLPPLRACPPRG